MYKTFEINIPIKQHYRENANAIFYNNPFVLSESECFLNYTDNYQPHAFQDEIEIFHILFNGKKIKQPISDKKTLITIKKLDEKKICSSFKAIKTFSINQREYPLEKVNNIILCDLIYTKGGIFQANEIHAAVFFPYFMEKIEQSEKVTLIFANIVCERFHLVAKRIFKDLGFNIYIDGKSYNLNSISKEDFCRWLTLHEYIHNSGPLSLFRSQANKFATKPYGFIEEMRVDFTTIKVLLEHTVHHPEQKNLLEILVIIILERIFRGALYNFHPEWKSARTGMLAKEVEGDVSISLLCWLNQHDMLNIATRTINLNLSKLIVLINEVLGDIYNYEQLAHDKQAFDLTALKFSAFFREKHISIPPEVIAFLHTFAVQDCQYFVKFNSTSLDNDF